MGDAGTADNSGAYIVTIAPVPVCATTLDDFNRPKGSLGPNWAGSVSRYAYKIVNQRVDVERGGPVYWTPTVFGPDQEACVTLSQIDPNGQHLSVMLKAQNGHWRYGSIFVFYNATTHQVGIETYLPGRGWQTLVTFDMVLSDGDQLGGRAEADGTVHAYVNGVEVGSAKAGSFFVDKGGQIGLWFIVAADTVLDDFSGR